MSRNTWGESQKTCLETAVMGRFHGRLYKHLWCYDELLPFSKIHSFPKFRFSARLLQTGVKGSRLKSSCRQGDDLSSFHRSPWVEINNQLREGVDWTRTQKGFLNPCRSISILSVGRVSASQPGVRSISERSADLQVCH